MKIRIHTLWAALVEDEGAFWMLHAEDEFSYEGDPDRCDAAFKTAKANADRNGWVTRVVIITIESGEVEKAFLPLKIEGSVAT